MFELDYLTQRLTFTKSDLAHPQLIAGYAPTFTGDVLEIEVEVKEPLKAQLDAFVVGDPDRRAPVRGRRGRRLGGPHRHRAARGRVLRHAR